MMLSQRYKFIFIHNYKAAGLSICKALIEYGLIDPLKNLRLSRIIEERSLLRRCFHKKITRLALSRTGKRISAHIKARELKKILPGKTWKDYYKFGFVRNPWDWQVSLYHFIKKHNWHFLGSPVKKSESFREYLEWRVNEDKHLQKDFFYDEKGNCLVDFIGRFENIESDFKRMCQKIGVKAVLPHINKTDHDEYRKYYNERTKTIISNHFKQDIELFGYTFGNDSQRLRPSRV